MAPRVSKRLIQDAKKSFQQYAVGFVGRKRGNANRKHLTFNITAADVIRQAEKQNYQCALSGLPLACPRKIHASGRTRKLRRAGETVPLFEYHPELGAASLDRIDNSRGYEPDNIQLVLQSVNMMRGALSVDDFIALCKKVAKHNP